MESCVEDAMDVNMHREEVCFIEVEEEEVVELVVVVNKEDRSMIEEKRTLVMDSSITTIVKSLHKNPAEIKCFILSVSKT
jgi:translation elongation factor EF-1alpha